MIIIYLSTYIGLSLNSYTALHLAYITDYRDYLSNWKHVLYFLMHFVTVTINFFATAHKSAQLLSVNIWRMFEQSLFTVTPPDLFQAPIKKSDYVIWRLWVRIPPGAGLITSSFSSYDVFSPSIPTSGVSLIRFLKEVHLSLCVVKEIEKNLVNTFNNYNSKNGIYIDYY